MDQTVRFWDRIAERYSKQPIADEAAYQKKLNITQQYLRPDMQMLEFGCGTGSTAITHAPRVKHIQAIDISANMLQIAQAKAQAQGVDNITFIHAAIDDFRAPDSSFDVVLGLSILHLLDNKEVAIAKVFNLLKPGGIFVTSTVCLGDSLWRHIRFVAPLGRMFGLLPLLRVFTSEELEDSLLNAGFAIDYTWQPGKDKAVFIVAKKPEH